MCAFSKVIENSGIGVAPVDEIFIKIVEASAKGCESTVQSLISVALNLIEHVVPPLMKSSFKWIPIKGDSLTPNELCANLGMVILKHVFNVRSVRMLLKVGSICRTMSLCETSYWTKLRVD